jgi:hypothetical protein
MDEKENVVELIGYLGDRLEKGKSAFVSRDQRIEYIEKYKTIQRYYLIRGYPDTTFVQSKNKKAWRES